MRPALQSCELAAAAVLTCRTLRPDWGDDDDDMYALARRLSLEPSGEEAGEAEAAADADELLLGVT